MYWFSEYGVDSLCIGCSGLPYKVPPRAVATILVRLEIPSLLRDNLLFSSSLQLVFLHSLVLIDPIYQLTHTGGRFASQGFLQAMLGWEVAFEGVDGDVNKVAIHFIIHLPISA